jgi:CDP-6-deoxy-D-xylo-4-hexulose-3-dehydrase
MTLEESSKQPYMIGQKFRVSGNLKNTVMVINKTFWLGTFPALNELHLDFIGDRLKKNFDLNF